MEEKYEDTDYYLTQCLIRHGYFQSYLKNIIKTVKRVPLLSKSAKMMQINHTFFVCMGGSNTGEHCKNILSNCKNIPLDNTIEMILYKEECGTMWHVQ